MQKYSLGHGALLRAPDEAPNHPGTLAAAFAGQPATRFWTAGFPGPETQGRSPSTRKAHTSFA